MSQVCYVEARAILASRGTMKRRVHQVIGGLAVASPVALLAQPLPKVARIGFSGSALAAGSDLALPSEADIRASLRHACFVPIADFDSARKQ
jgi:hypothetical protein